MIERQFKGEMPDRIRKLPVSENGYPVPWFVLWVEGKPEFRFMDQDKWIRAINESRCWVCGEKLGSNKAFVIGPMCGLNRTTSEPPGHLDCARWSVQNCPFLSNPNMIRREDETTRNSDKNSAGVMIKRNPGVSLIWVTRKYHIFRDDKGRPLITIGDPILTEWWAKGRRASRSEVSESVESGCPILLSLVRPEEMPEFQSRKKWLETLYPEC